MYFKFNRHLSPWFVCKLIYLYSLWENVFSLCRTDKIENIQSIDIAKKREKKTSENHNGIRNNYDYEKLNQEFR